MSLLDRHVEFVEALRGAGLPVSLAEDLDAVSAVGQLDLLDRDAVRAGYAATLVKRAAHRPSFDAVFDLFYPPLLGSGVESRLGDEPVEDHDSAETLRAFRDSLAQALVSGDPETIARLAREGVARFGAMPGRAEGMASWSAYNTLRRTSPDTLISRIAQGLMAELGDEPAARAAAGRRIGQYTKQVESEARRRIAEEKTPGYVAAATLRPTIDQIAFVGARQHELVQLRREIYPLARRLATRLAREQHKRRGGPLDFRRTVRASIATGGVPLSTHHRPRRPHRTDLVVLCDVSGSVASFAQFTLMLVYALRDQFTRVRAFTFVDEVHEVTGYFKPGGDLVETMKDLAGSVQHASVWGRTNYGRSLSRFAELHSDALGPKSSLLILGDARSNGADLRVDVVKEIVGQTRHAWWLNPENRRSWDTGDSAARTYGELIPMVECRNLTQLGDFVQRLV